MKRNVLLLTANHLILLCWSIWLLTLFSWEPSLFLPIISFLFLIAANGCVLTNKCKSVVVTSLLSLALLLQIVFAVVFMIEWNSTQLAI